MGRFFTLLALVLFSAAPATAGWYRASSDHFVIYTDDDEKDLREFALRLERYHAAMSIQMGVNAPAPSPSNRVTVYVVRNAGEVRKLFGSDADKNLGGFYVPRAGGSFAIIPKVNSSGVEATQSELTLFHEYAHHFMYGSQSVAFPRWVSEGFAEFYAASKFEKDGSVGLGLPAAHRAGELAFAVNVPLTQLLDTPTYLANRSKSYDEFYGKSWAMFHYLRFADERKGQFQKYLNLIFSGKKEIDAANEAFGDLKVMEKDLDRYIHQRRLHYFKIMPNDLKVGEIAITPLDAGHAAIMPMIIRSKRGVNDESAKALVPEVRAIATKFPENAAVLSELAEAEFDAGNNDAAIAAADKALAVEPTNINAMLQKGYAMARLAENADDDADPKRWTKVRSQFVKVNKLENDHPIPLINFYRTYIEQGETPPEIAMSGLEHALELAPFDVGLRMNVAQQQLFAGRNEVAIETLKPLAYSPHDSELAAIALQMIETAKAAPKAGDEAEEDTMQEDTETAE